MELKNNGKINFIIDLFLNLNDFISGGLIALHKLAYELANEGHNVYIFCEPAYPHKNITVIQSEINIQKGHRFSCTWQGFTYNLNNTVSIYPEHASGNKFNTRNNVRWIMYHTTHSDEENFGANDYIFNFGNFKTYTNREDGKLRVIDYNLNKFFIEDENRSGYCHIIGKQTPKNYLEIIKQFNSTDITDYKNQTNLDLLRKELNKYEYFITFDQKTYLTTAAVLCGCKTIILIENDSEFEFEYSTNLIKNANMEEINHNNLTPIEYKLQNPENLFGVAYGISDLSWCNNTLHLVRDYIEELNSVNSKTIRNFVKFWENKIN